MPLPVIAGIGRVVAGSIGRVTVVAVTRLGAVAKRGSTKLLAAYGRLVSKYGKSARTFFRGKGGKKPVRVNTKRALMKIQNIEQIIEKVFQDALPEMRRHTAKRSGTLRGSQRLEGKYKLRSDATYSSYVDKPNFQKNDVSAEGKKFGFSKPTKDFIKREIKSRIKKELGR